MNEWKCLNCGESAPRHFMRCWKCGTGRDGQTAGPYFPDTSTIDNKIQAPDRFGVRHLAPAVVVWLVLSSLGVFAISWFTQLLPPTLVNQIAATVFVFLSGIIIAVVMNVLGELGSWMQRHFGEEIFDDFLETESADPNSQRGASSPAASANSTIANLRNTDASTFNSSTNNTSTRDSNDGNGKHDH